MGFRHRGERMKTKEEIISRVVSRKNVIKGTLRYHQDELESLIGNFLECYAEGTQGESDVKKIENKLEKIRESRIRLSEAEIILTEIGVKDKENGWEYNDWYWYWGNRKQRKI